VTVTVQIGNSDDKLKQSAWSGFVHEVECYVKTHANEVHFFGASAGWMKWQNAAWVIDCDEDELPFLKRVLKKIREKYGQSSVAVTEGKTQFV
jgi:hypothetical protein